MVFYFENGQKGDRVGIDASSVIILAAGPSPDNAIGTKVVFDVLIKHTPGHALYTQALQFYFTHCSKNFHSVTTIG
jgi:hypothetical protein